jgi:hypothetical protein
MLPEWIIEGKSSIAKVPESMDVFPTIRNKIQM